MSDFCVTLVLKLVIDISQLLDFEYFASLVLEHYSLDSRLYGQTLNKKSSARHFKKSTENIKKTCRIKKISTFAAGKAHTICSH